METTLEKQIETNKRSMNFAAVFFASASSAVVLGVIRIVLQRFYIDPGTGFYTQKSFLSIAFYVLFGISAVAFFLAGVLSRNTFEIKVNGVRSKSWIFAVLLAVAFVFDGVSVVIGGFSGNSMAMTVAATNVVRFGNIFRLVFAVISAVWFIIVGASMKTGSDTASNRKILALSPAVWASVRLLTLFTTEISFVRVSDLLIEIVALAFTALFFINFAQQTCGVYNTGSAWKLFSYGVPAAVSLFCYSFPKLIFTFVESGKYINSDYRFCFVDLAAALFIFSFIFSRKAAVVNECVVEDNAAAEPEMNEPAED